MTDNPVKHHRVADPSAMQKNTIGFVKYQQEEPL